MSQERLTDKRKEHRREMDKTCALHNDSMRDIFAQIGKMVPIWVFLATLTIVGGVFSYITYLSHQVSAKAELQVKETADLARASIKEISESISVVKTNQAVTLYRLDNISKDLEALKQQSKAISAVK